MKTAPKFRGKRVDNGEWVEGCYVEIASKMACIGRKPSRHFIVFQQFCDWGFDPNVQAEVDPSTVEQIGGDVVDENKSLRELLENAACIISEYRHLSLSEIVPCLDFDTKAGMFVDQDVKEALKEK